MRAVNVLFNYKVDSLDQKIAGVEKVFLDYSELLIKSGWQVLSIAKPGMAYRQNLLDMGSEIYEVNALGHADILTMVKLAISLRKFKPDVIICHSGRAFFMARIASRMASIFKRIPIVAVNHGIKVKKFLKADYIISVNSYFANEIIKLGKDKNHSLVIPNMISVPGDFTPPQNKKFHSPIKIGSLGRISGHKQYQTVVQAIAILKTKNIEVEFLLAGEGGHEDCVRDVARQLNVENNIKFLGWIKDKKSFFEAIDIFVLPSVDETFGIVLLEAMLYKTPIISGDSFGPNDIFVDGVDALIIPTRNVLEVPEPLAKAIERLINDQNFAMELAENAYKKFHQKYTTTIVGEQIKNLLTTIIKNNQQLV